MLDVKLANPYVGPRPFGAEHRDLFFGRDREVAEIVALILGHPLVLVYATSGAGKTSLFNAGVLPELQAEGCETPGLLRVGGARPPGIGVADVRNVFAFDALLSLAPGADPRSLCDTTLADHLLQRSRSPGIEEGPAPLVLIFDQFEELFTTPIADTHAQQAGFFDQLGAAVEQVPQLRVVLVIREDHVAEVDPFARSLPGRLRARYRLERLAEPAARRAVEEPAARMGRRYAAGAVDRLLAELLTTVAVTGADERILVRGRHVEPVQLQVVCHSLWERSVGGHEIQLEDSPHEGVDRALGRYYDEAVGAAAAVGRVAEDEVRRWFDGILITEMGTRGQALKSLSGGVPAAAVEELERRHLIRAEQRAGALWYEITHDRFIEPIRARNRVALPDPEQHPVAVQARVWDRLGRREDGVLRGAQLDEARAWAARVPVGDLVRDLLDASDRAARSALRNWRRNAVLLALLAVAAAAFAVVSAYLFLDARDARDAAREAEAVARSEAARSADLAAEGFRLAMENASLSVAASARAALASELDLGLLLAVEAVDIPFRTPSARAALVAASARAPRLVRFLHPDGPVTAIAASPDGATVVLGTEADTFEGRPAQLVFFDADRGQPTGMVDVGFFAGVEDLAFSPNGAQLAVALSERGAGELSGEIQVFAADRTLLARWDAHPGGAKAVAFDETGAWLATAGFDGIVELREPDGTWMVALGFGQDGSAFDVDVAGDRIVAAQDTGLVLVWRGEELDDYADPMPLWQHDSPATKVAIAGEVVVVGHGDGSLDRWDLRTGERLPGERLDAAVTALDGDGDTVVAGTAAGEVVLWPDVAERRVERMSVDTERVGAVALGPGGAFYTGSPGGAAIQWTAASPVGRTVAADVGSRVAGIAFAGQEPAVLTVDGAAWRAGSPVVELAGGAAALAADGGSLAIAAEDRVELRSLPGGDLIDSLTTPAAPSVVGAGPARALAGAGGGLVVAQSSTGAPFEIEVAARTTALAFDGEGEWLAVGAASGAVAVHDAGTGEEVARTRAHAGEVAALAFAPGGEMLASAGADGLAVLWEWHLEGPARRLSGHDSSLHDVAISPDGGLLATASRDGTVWLWATATGERLGDPLLPQSGASPTAVAFGPRMEALAIGGADGVVEAMELRLGLLQQHACARANRSLTPAEWDLHVSSVGVYEPACPSPG